MNLSYTDMSQSWANLANTIRGVGNDYYNAELGVAKFLDDKRMNDIKAQEANLRIAEQSIKLNEMRKQERELNRPFTVDDVGNLIGDAGSAEKRVEYLHQGDKILSSMGYTVQEDGTYKTKDGYTLDRRTFKNIAPALMSTVVASLDDKVAFKSTMDTYTAKAKQIQADPNLTEDEKATKIADVAVNVKRLYSTYNELSENKTLRAGLMNQDRITQKMAALSEAAGKFAAYGSPETVKLIDEQYKVAAEQLKENNMNNLKLQGYVPVSDKMAKQLGLPQGLYVPPESMASLAHTVGAMNIAAARNKHELKEADRGRMLTAILTQTDAQVKQVMSTLPKDAQGNLIYEAKDKFGRKTGEMKQYTPSELAQMHSTLYNQFFKENSTRLGVGAFNPSKGGATQPQTQVPTIDKDRAMNVINQAELAIKGLPWGYRGSAEKELAKISAGGQITPQTLDAIEAFTKKLIADSQATPVGGLNRITDSNDLFLGSMNLGY